MTWFYFGSWVKKSAQTESTKLLIERWKASNLSIEEQNAWNILGNLRDEDAHMKPVVTKKPQGGRPLFDDKTGRPLFSEKSGKKLCSDNKPYRVIQDRKEYELVSLCQHGLTAFQKFFSKFDDIT